VDKRLQETPKNLRSDDVPLSTPSGHHAELSGAFVSYLPPVGHSRAEFLHSLPRNAPYPAGRMLSRDAPCSAWKTWAAAWTAICAICS